MHRHHHRARLPGRKIGVRIVRIQKQRREADAVTSQRSMDSRREEKKSWVEHLEHPVQSIGLFFHGKHLARVLLHITPALPKMSSFVRHPL